MGFWITLLVLIAILALAWRFLGAYMADVYSGKSHWLGWLEHPILSLIHIYCCTARAAICVKYDMVDSPA